MATGRHLREERFEPVVVLGLAGVWAHGAAVSNEAGRPNQAPCQARQERRAAWDTGPDRQEWQRMGNGTQGRGGGGGCGLTAAHCRVRVLHAGVDAAQQALLLLLAQRGIVRRVEDVRRNVVLRGTGEQEKEKLQDGGEQEEQEPTAAVAAPSARRGTWMRAAPLHGTRERAAYRVAAGDRGDAGQELVRAAHGALLPSRPRRLHRRLQRAQTSQQLSSAGSLQWPATLLYAACATTYVHALFLSAGSETADYHIYYYGCMYFGRTDK